MDFDRYSRQMRFAPLGEAGQRRLAGSRVLVCGCGALGTVLANTLVRAGVGQVRVVDRDYVETNNLQRQVLFDESDVASALPKAVAAAEKLRRINSQVTIEPIVADVAADNLVELCADVDCIVDGTDNFETRFLLNDASIKLGIPWVYGGAIGAEGQTMTIIPDETACLRCVMADAPPPGAAATCDTAGVVGPIIGVIASVQSMEAIKILSGNRAAIRRTLLVFDLWDNTVRQIKLDNLREKGDCACCQRHEFSWLEGQRGSHSAVLCGRNAVQISAAGGGRVSLEQLEQQLAPMGQVRRNAFLLRATIEPYQLTVFPDGRAIIVGTDDLSVARTVYARYIGS